MTDKEVPMEQLLAQMGREIHLAEPAEEREERRARVVSRLRDLHVQVLDQRGRGRRTRRVAVGLMAAALLAMTGSALATAAGFGPFASVLPGAGTRTRPLADPGSGSRSAEREATPRPVATTEQGAMPMSAPPVLSPPQPHSTEARLPARVPTSAEPTSEKQRELAAVNALFADAKRARREHRDLEALSLFEQLLAKYPRSVLVHEASIERFRALARLGRTEEAKRHAAAYLSRYPGGYAGDEARKLAGVPETP